MATIAPLLVVAVEIYALIGGLFAILFVARGVAVVDPAASGAPLGFRLLILPASAALWPWLAWRWVGSRGPRAERNAHRDAARDPGDPS